MSELSKGIETLAKYGEQEAQSRSMEGMAGRAEYGGLRAEPQAAEDWAVSESHARKMIAALQNGIRRDRAVIADLQASVTRNVESLRAVQAKAYREGWDL